MREWCAHGLQWNYLECGKCRAVLTLVMIYVMQCGAVHRPPGPYWTGQGWSTKENAKLYASDDEAAAAPGREHPGHRARSPRQEMNKFRKLIETYSQFDVRWAQEVQSRGIVVTCQRGCSACCWEPCYTSPAEARLALSKVPAPERADVVQRTRLWLAKAQKSGILEVPEPHVMAYKAVGLACPLLKDNLCLTYAHRPFACRSHCAVGPSDLCRINRLNQTYTHSPEMVWSTGCDIFMGSGAGDHLGVWLARLLLRLPVRSSAYVDIDSLCAT